MSTRAVVPRVLRSSETFRSLRVPNYRRNFIGQLGSFAGTWMQQAALAWLVVKELGYGGKELGLLAVCTFLPLLLLGSWGGLIADRHDKLRIQLATQTWLGAWAAVLAVLTLTDHVTLTVVYVVTAASGIATAFDNPARQSFVSELVGPDDLTNAVALNSSAFSAARVVGPAFAGLAIRFIGTGWCFAINAVSFLAVIAALLTMDRSAIRRSTRPSPAKGQIRDGLRYAWGHPPLRETFLVAVTVGLFAFNHQVIIPIMARDVFKGGSGLFSVFTACAAVGALTAALLAARRTYPSRSVIVRASWFHVLTLSGTALAPWAWLVAVFLVLSGITLFSIVLTCNARIQRMAGSAYRGRMMALWSMVIVGLNVVGGPLTGWIIDRSNARWGWGMSAVVTALLAVAVTMRTPVAEREAEEAAAATEPIVAEGSSAPRVVPAPTA